MKADLIAVLLISPKSSIQHSKDGMLCASLSNSNQW